MDKSIVSISQFMIGSRMGSFRDMLRSLFAGGAREDRTSRVLDKAKTRVVEEEKAEIAKSGRRGPVRRIFK